MDFFTNTHLNPKTYKPYNSKLNKWISLMPSDTNTIQYILTHPNFSVVTLGKHHSETNTDTFAGNSELDKINVVVSPAFTGSASIDMITDSDFTIVMKDKYVEDFAPIGSTNLANYITRTLSLANSAESLKIIFDACIVSRTSVKVYYRAWSGDTDLRYLPWQDTGWVNTDVNPEGVFSERNIDLSGLTEFTNVTLKIVMRSTDSSKVPQIKNLRMIAHS
jgi:hypothetical protein